MMDSRIEWTDDTVSPWWGCAKVSPACMHCYAETFDARGLVDGGGHWGPSAPRFIRVDKAIADLDRIARRSDREGRPRRVFMASMSDFFEDRADLVESRKRIWHHLHSLGRRITPMLLTKRPDVMAAWAKEHGWPDGAWAGTTVEDQRRADERVPSLLRVPAEVRFLSMEPLLGPVNLRFVAPQDDWHIDALDTPDPSFRIGWVIAGGESGPNARPSHPDWFRSIRDQCEYTGVPFFFKQWGAYAMADQLPDEVFRAVDASEGGIPSHGEPLRLGKKRTGRLLDGRTWDERPEVSNG